MSRHPLDTAILAGVLGLGLPILGRAQTKRAAQPNTTKAQAAKQSPTAPKLPLKDLDLISTTQAAREATKGKGQSTAKSGQSPAGAILEFHPVKSGSTSDSPSKDAHLKNSKKPLLKDFHGSVYGAAAGQGAEGSTAAGDVGASSGNGELNVFIKGQHSQTSNPGTH